MQNPLLMTLNNANNDDKENFGTLMKKQFQLHAR